MNNNLGQLTNHLWQTVTSVQPSNARARKAVSIRPYIFLNSETGRKFMKYALQLADNAFAAGLLASMQGRDLRTPDSSLACLLLRTTQVMQSL